MNVRDKNKLTRVVAFDYDGVLAMQHNGPDSLEIMKKALLTVYGSREVDPKKAQLFWRTLFQETKGTTEQNVFARFCVMSGFSHTPQKYREYVSLRTQLIAVWNREHKIASFDEGKIYPDVYGALDTIKSNPTYRTLIAIVTGNPEPVMRVRAPKELLSRVDYVVGGSRGNTRMELLDRTRRIAKTTFAWAPHYDQQGEIDNLTFIDDVPRGALSHPQEWRSVAIIRPDNPQWEMRVYEDQAAAASSRQEYLMRAMNSLSRQGKTGPVIIGEGDSYRGLMTFQSFLDLGMKPETAYSLAIGSTSHRPNSAYMTTTLADPLLYEFIDPPRWAELCAEGTREPASSGRRK